MIFRTLFLQDTLHFEYSKEVLAPSSSNLVDKSLHTTGPNLPPGQSLWFDVKKLYSLMQRSKHCTQTVSGSSSLSQVSVTILISYFTECRCSYRIESFLLIDCTLAKCTTSLSLVSQCITWFNWKSILIRLSQTIPLDSLWDWCNSLHLLIPPLVPCLFSLSLLMILHVFSSSILNLLSCLTLSQIVSSSALSYLIGWTVYTSCYSWLQSIW